MKLEAFLRAARKMAEAEKELAEREADEKIAAKFEELRKRAADPE